MAYEAKSGCRIVFKKRILSVNIALITLRFEKWSISGLLTFNNRLVSLSRFLSVVFFRSLGAQAVLIEMNHLSSLTMGDEATASKYFSTPEGKKRFRR